MFMYNSTLFIFGLIITYKKIQIKKKVFAREQYIFPQIVKQYLKVSQLVFFGKHKDKHIN